MTSAQLDAKLTELLGLPAEIEWMEFKEAKNNYDFDDLGKCFSSLSNEADLLQEMRREGTIRTEGSKRWAKWRIT